MGLLENAEIKNNQLGICLLNYNGTKDTIECIESIKKYNDIVNEGIVIAVLDNNSNEQDYNNLIHSIISITGIDQVKVLTVKELYELTQINTNVIIVRSEINTGFAKGNNILLNFFEKHNFNFALLLNNDTVIIDDSIKQCVRYMQSHSNVGVCTVNVCYYDSPDCSWSAGSQFLAFGHRKYISNKQIQRRISVDKPIAKVKFITGCYLFVRIAIIKQYGALTENFFFGEEDYDFALRMKENHIKQVSLLNCKILHKVSSSINKFQNETYATNLLHYTQRYINMKLHCTTTVWHIWRIFYSMILLILLKFRRIHQPFSLLKTINMLSQKYNQVDEKLFLDIINGKFVKQINQ